MDSLSPSTDRKGNLWQRNPFVTLPGTQEWDGETLYSFREVPFPFWSELSKCWIPKEGTRPRLEGTLHLYMVNEVVFIYRDLKIDHSVFNWRSDQKVGSRIQNYFKQSFPGLTRLFIFTNVVVSINDIHSNSSKRHKGLKS